MSNIKSSNITIFPISFDRSAGSTFKYWQRNSTPYTGDDEVIKAYLETNLIISNKLPTINSIDLSNYYTDITSSASPSHTYANGRILSEKNVSTLIRSLTDHACFVVDSDVMETANSLCNWIEFIMNGRYFHVNLADSGLSNNNNLWVGIKLLDAGEAFETLLGYDVVAGESPSKVDYLNGIDFSAEELYDKSADGDYDYVLQLLETSGNNVKIPIASKFKFNSNSIKNIYGGTV